MMLAATLAVSVFGLFHPERLTVKPLPGTVVEIEAGATRFVLEGGQSAGLRAVADLVDCFARRQLVSSPHVRVTGRGGRAADLRLAVPGKIERRFRGTLEVSVRAGALLAVLSTDLETAVASAVAAESAPGAAAEALKALAVVARSYYLATRPRHDGFDFCDTTHCQFLREPPLAGPSWDAAEATRGLALAYQGAVVAALHSASCGGRTRAPEDVVPYPYFAVDCPHCQRNAPAWERRLSLADGAPLLERPGSEALRLAVVRKLGWSALPGNNYEARREGDMIVIRGRGSGHGVGLCQQGAAAMAAEGAGFRVILAHYFPNTALIGERIEN